ncbi:uncharacterized protein PITG_22930 [Phytophthora infestans T30-4]|uniref:Uncharacterized protein n=1 Tax=Phytophthora infestans (strain T30-4) TaxID=403677 RepID=D0NGC6_PHYIT|nr:uncharacterized protein PITG_22930 [Phytophthora infestans T30-4]EEY57327.1 conserved hypothetical protein [Phytophthora infestans T30-4]|eukprot:XP_002901937.1 conserved hypothetical protein [Phytophthora infestans T30-4]
MTTRWYSMSVWSWIIFLSVRLYVFCGRWQLRIAGKMGRPSEQAFKVQSCQLHTSVSHCRRLIGHAFKKDTNERDFFLLQPHKMWKVVSLYLY